MFLASSGQDLASAGFVFRTKATRGTSTTITVRNVRRIAAWLRRAQRQDAIDDEYVEVEAGESRARVVVWRDGWANVVSDQGDFEEFVESPADLARLLAEAGVPTEHADDLWRHFAGQNAKR